MMRWSAFVPLPVCSASGRGHSGGVLLERPWLRRFGLWVNLRARRLVFRRVDAARLDTRQVIALDIHDPGLCLRLFRANFVRWGWRSRWRCWLARFRLADVTRLDRAEFILANTHLVAAPLVPENRFVSGHRDHADLAGD